MVRDGIDERLGCHIELGVGRNARGRAVSVDTDPARELGALHLAILLERKNPLIKRRDEALPSECFSSRAPAACQSRAPRGRLHGHIGLETLQSRERLLIHCARDPGIRGRTSDVIAGLEHFSVRDCDVAARTLRPTGTVPFSRMKTVRRPNAIGGDRGAIRTCG